MEKLGEISSCNIDNCYKYSTSKTDNMDIKF